MEKTNRLHPLLTAAAISVSVFSAVGVATLTGLVPQSIGSQKEPAALEAPRGAVKAMETAPKVSEAPRTVEAPKAIKPRVVRKAAPRPGAPSAILATVEDVKEVTTPGEHTAIGPIAGGVAGAVLGSQIGGGNGRKIATVLGALGGAMAGKHIEKQARGEKHWETVVRLEDGSQRTVQSAVQPFWHAGDRVRFLNGTLQPV
jgi:outer membrane lipoprotein SlyB